MPTEDQALHMFCPMKRQIERGTPVPSVVNYWISPHGDGVDDFTRCVGSRCMMWRWQIKYRATKTGPIADGYTNEGHCGLAGK